MPKQTKAQKNLETRPPVVVVLGHIDHGKTKLLDFIRKTKVAEGEAGGITQHIGAYEIEDKGGRITFIDTPGHEAFSHIRSRGAKAADIAVLVVAAEEGVKPQTKEAIQHAKDAKIPFVVAINKIDKPNANPEKVKGELKEEGVVVESYGGDTPSVNISAKEGTGVDELLEVIQLVAELQELKADPAKNASGVVLESHLDSRRGPTATLLVLEGSLRVNNWIVVGDTYGKAKSLADFLGRGIGEAGPSRPVVLTGISETVDTGDTFEVVASEEEARKRSAAYLHETPDIQEASLETPSEEAAGGEKKQLSLVLKADVLGSLEAVRGVFREIGSPEVGLKIVKSEVGDINESDVKFASSAGAHIFGFKVSCGKLLHDLAKRHRVKIFLSPIIYELVEQAKREAAKLMPIEKIRHDLGKLTVLALFGRKEKGRVVGGKVVSGKIKKGSMGDVMRGGEVVCSGRILQLQRNKSDIEEVARGDECGILFRGDCDVHEGDEIIVYEEEERRREL